MTIQWSVSRVRLLILCEILLVVGGLSPDLSTTGNYQVLHKLLVRARLFVGCTLVIMKSLSRQTNINCNHIIISWGRGHPIITRDNYYSIHSSDWSSVYQQQQSFLLSSLLSRLTLWRQTFLSL